MDYVRKKITGFFEYDTRKIIHIPSKRIGITNRFLQLLIIFYIIGYVIIWNKGYQIKVPVSSAVTSKVKGVVITNPELDQLHVPDDHKELYRRIWDPTDYVIPTSGGELGGFFVMTNVIITPNQTRGNCPESYKIAPCTNDANCPKGFSTPIANGVFTGKCVEGLTVPNKSCEISAWCPVELQHGIPIADKALLEGAKGFTVLIKNVIKFPHFGPEYKRRNILNDSDVDYLTKCVHSKDHPFCPVFRIGNIVESAGESFSKVAVKGGVFEIGIDWNCNLDYDFTENCLPKYSFERLDIPDTLFSPGWNFRTAEYHGQDQRTLFKNYGIKFLVKVSGQAGKFNLVPLLINLGSGIALLGLARFFCDFLVLWCLSNSEYYKDQKFQVVRGSEYFSNSNSDSEINLDPPREGSAGSVGTVDETKRDEGDR